MRILMLDNEFPPLGGGMGTANKAMLEQIAARTEIAVDLVTAARGGRQEFVQFAEHIRIFKVPVWNRNIHHSSNRELITYALFAFFKSLALLRREHYDLCFAWSGVPAGAVAYGLKRLSGLPYMTRVTGPDIPGFEQRYERLYPFLKPVLRQVWGNSTPLIAKCQAEVDLIRQTDPSAQAAIIENGVDLSRFAPGAPAPDGGPLVVVCAARLIERKGQEHLIRALAEVVRRGADVEVRLVGDGDAKAEYERLAAEMGVSGRVAFTGFVPPEGMPAQYAAGHVFALPSYQEGMSLATLEAMASGLPLVVSRTGGTEDMVVEGINGHIFEWGDLEALAGRLFELAEDRAQVRRMGKASLERARLFSWDGVMAQYLRLFEAVQASLQASEKVAVAEN